MPANSATGKQFQNGREKETISNRAKHQKECLQKILSINILRVRIFKEIKNRTYIELHT
jgi:hypothetical protein